MRLLHLTATKQLPNFRAEISAEDADLVDYDGDPLPFVAKVWMCTTCDKEITSKEHHTVEVCLHGQTTRRISNVIWGGETNPWDEAEAAKDWGAPPF